jgi:hypothetical protein
LADIVSDGLECEGVQFIPWNYEIPVALQVDEEATRSVIIWNRICKYLYIWMQITSFCSVSIMYFIGYGHILLMYYLYSEVLWE